MGVCEKKLRLFLLYTMLYADYFDLNSYVTSTPFCKKGIFAKRVNLFWSSFKTLNFMGELSLSNLIDRVSLPMSFHEPFEFDNDEQSNLLSSILKTPMSLKIKISSDVQNGLCDNKSVDETPF